MSEILEYVSKILPVAVTAAIALLAAIAPLTKSETDNKVLNALRWLEDKILSVLFPTLKPRDVPDKDDLMKP